jgi:o-succinylbenzoate synthase
VTVLDGLDIRVVRIPMRLRFRRLDRREAVLVGGPAGWGEFSPFPEYPPVSAAPWLAAAVEAATRPWPAARRDRIPVNLTVPAVEPGVAAGLVAASACRTVKVKVAEPGRAFVEDVARVAAVREALGPDGRIRVDVNGAWSVDEAEHRLSELAAFDLEYAEQPCATVEELAELRRRVNVPIAADESIRTAADPERVVELGAADVAVLKVQPLGGVTATLALAGRLGLPIVISSALETSVGIAAGLAAAAALPELRHACGLGTVSLLDGDVVRSPLLAEDGMLEVRRPAPDPELVERARPDSHTERRLLDRLRETASLLEAA